MQHQHYLYNIQKMSLCLQNEGLQSGILHLNSRESFYALILIFNPFWSNQKGSQLLLQLVLDRQMDEDSHSYYLIKQSQTILSQLREQARKIESAEQKITTNLRNIRSGQNQTKPLSNISFSSQMNITHPPSNYSQSHNNQNTQHFGNTLEQKNYQFSKIYQEMDNIEEYPEDLESMEQEQKIQQSSHTTLNQFQNMEEMSFANSSAQPYKIPSCQIVFVPFNKLYRSPILQLKDKNRLILARKYKGSNMSIKDGKICDGTIFKFNKIITDEDQLLDLLTDCSSVGLIGASGTLKKKIHMCLFIKHYQKLLARLQKQSHIQSTLHVQYIELINSSIVIHIHELFRFNNQTRRSEACRITNIFQNILSEMLSKCKENQKIKVRHRTRVIRILEQETGQKFEVVSSTNETEEIFQEFRFQKVVWCINPLVKHYEMSKNTLQFAKKVQKCKQR